MSDDLDVKTYSADPEDPEALAREAVEAMRVTGPVNDSTTRAIIAAGQAHARVLDKINEPEVRD